VGSVVVVEGSVVVVEGSVVVVEGSVVVVEGSVVVVVEGSVVVVVVGVPPLPHEVPLIAKPVGAGFAVVHPPRKPMLTVPPEDTALFHDRFVAVTLVPAWLQSALQPWATFCPASPKVNVKFQAVRGSEVLWIVTLDTKPPGHELAV
jgi:hypothetical protein